MYSQPQTRPIPFVDPLQLIQDACNDGRRAVSRTALAPPTPSLPPQAAGTQATAHAACAAILVKPMAVPRRAMPARTAHARYDGAHALNVRSCTTGQVYRFTRPGEVLTIDAADISLMKRIEQITLLA